MSEISQWIGNNITEITHNKKLQESMDRCSCHSDITEIILKTAIIIKQSIITFIAHIDEVLNHIIHVSPSLMSESLNYFTYLIF